MPTPANSSKGATPASPTGTTGANSSASSPAAETSVQSPSSSRAAIRADIEKLTADADDGADDAVDTESAGDQPSAADAEKNAAADAGPPAEKSKDDKGKDGAEKTVPLAALKKVEEKARKKLDDVRGQLHAKDLALKKSTEAVKLLTTRVQRLEGLLKQGAKYDENAEKIDALELEKEARAAVDRISTDHAKVLEAAKKEAELSFEAERLSEEIDGAVSARNGLFDRARLIAEMRKDLSKSAEEVAAALETQLLELARPRLVKTQPAHPASVRAQRGGGTNTVVEYGHDRKGIREHTEALERARRANSQ